MAASRWYSAAACYSPEAALASFAGRPRDFADLLRPEHLRP